MFKRIIAIICVATLLQPAFAQTFNTAKLDSFFTALETNEKFMGSVAILKEGKPIYTRSIGYSDSEKKVKAINQTRYRVGSVSKTFTAVLVFKAIEEKKLSLDQSLARFYPTIPNAEKITIAHLLAHRSGVHSFTSDKSFRQWKGTAKTEEEMIEIITKGGSDFEPGTKAVYSNPNYVLLSYILQKVYNKPYAQLLEERITKPLGLQQTYFGDGIDPKKNESYSYRFTGIFEKEEDTHLSIPMGAGGIVSTPIDIARFAEALFTGKLVSQQSLNQMKTMNDEYGMGLFALPFQDKQSYGHTGGIDGFATIFSYFPDEKISYALTSNGAVYLPNNVSLAMLSAVFNKPYDIPAFKKVTISQELLDSYTGQYSSQDVPMKIEITRKENTLVAQATGQPPIAMEALEPNIFQFERIGLVLEFNADKKEMIMKQRGKTFTFNKE